MKPKLFQSAPAWAVRDPMLLSGVVLLALSPLLLIVSGLDQRLLFERSPWDKPLRFALSLGIYAITMAIAAQWLLQREQLSQRRWLLGWRWLAPLLTATLTFEMTWMAIQAARGLDSHFNEATPFEELMFSLMGVGAALLSLGTLWLGVVASWLAFGAARINDRLIALGIALGFIGTGLLLPWTGEALVEAGRSQSAIQASTVIPLLGWRLDGSDPRPAHFVAAHIMQILPLAAVLMTRYGPSSRPGISALALFILNPAVTHLLPADFAAPKTADVG